MTIWTIYYKHKIIYCHISKYLKSWMREGHLKDSIIQLYLLNNKKTCCAELTF